MVAKLRRNLRKQRGFTLVELMIVVAIVGVLAALAIYGVRKYIANAKTAEARNSLGQMAKDATTAYAREGMSGTVLTMGSSTGIVNRLCETAASPVPANLTDVQAKKYQSSPAEWQAAGWSCLKFSMADPQYYQYNYTATGSGAVGDMFTAIAQGDLNGDGNPSNFQLRGSVQQASSGGPQLVIAPNIIETNPED